MKRLGLLAVALGVLAIGIVGAVDRDQRKQATDDSTRISARRPATRSLQPTAHPEPPEAAETPAPGPPASAPARELVDRLAALLSKGPLSDEDKATLAGIEAELLAQGEAAVPVLLARLDKGGDPDGTRDLLFHVLRQLPGRAAEDRVAHEARHGQREPVRAMAFDTLARQKTDRAFEVLAEVARTDPHIPARPLIAEARDPNDPNSTELPDEQVFTPRMQAMAALASTRDPRATGILADIARNGPDESIRMEAARNLGELRDDPRAREALRSAALNDASAYVRLAALHALQGTTDASLAPLLARIVAEDRDAGVRSLARQVLASLGQAAR